MRKNNDKRADKDIEIDEFLSQFDRDDTKKKSVAAEDKSTHSEKQNTKSSQTKKSTSASKASKKPAGKKSSSGKASSSKKTKKKSKKKPGLLAKIGRLFLPMTKNKDYDPNQGKFITKNGKKIKNNPTKFTFLGLIRTCVLLGIVCVLCFMVYAVTVITLAPSIDPTHIYDSVAQSSTVYDDKGKAVDTVYYNQDRTIISYDEMPENLINAFVALEDKTFWKHHGFNWTRMVGAVLQSFTGGGDISGTSTITQQLARNVYLADIKSERSIRRKIVEMYYASVIERKLTKEQIVEAYANTIYLGFGAYGVDAAAHAYYSKDPKDLTLVECASLAALPQAPDTYALVQYVEDGQVTEGTTNIIMRDPETYIANDISKDRRNTCLKFMLDQGYITQKAYKKAYDKDLIDFIDPSIKTDTTNDAYFTDYLIDQVENDLMEKLSVTQEEAERMIYEGGLNIYSTLDSTAQNVINKEFEDSSNFPGIYSSRTDGEGNIISDNGSILLYDFNNYFDGDNFSLSSDECKVNNDGSLTIKEGKRLNIYTTEANGTVDYSLEFKPTYIRDGWTVYMYSGGYINIPAEYKSLDKKDNLVISADYFNDYKDSIKLGDNTATITPKAYSLANKTIQPQAAMAIVEVGTGSVKALVGGRLQTGRQLYNRALNPRQSGSSIKPISVYSGALQKSFEYAENNQKFKYVDTGHDKQGVKYYGDYLTASSCIVDERMTFNGQTWPYNATNTFSGAMTMRKALQQSVNVCAVKLELQLGDEYCADLIERFGITTLDREGDVSDMNPAALALGGQTNGVIPLEMAQAYATFPNGGVRQSSVAYTKVTDRTGKVLIESSSEQTKVLDEGVAFIMTDMLKSVVSQGLGTPARLYGVDAGGKTGTTSQEYDIWFDGFTPTYAASLWIGNDVNMQLTSMSTPAAQLWGKIMNQIPGALKGTYPEQPSDVVRSGNEYYTKGTEGGKSTYISDQKKKAAKEAAEKKKREEEQARLKKEQEAEKQRKAEEAAKKKAEAAKKAAEEKKKQEQQKPEPEPEPEQPVDPPTDPGSEG